MARSRASSKAAGTNYETKIAKYLAEITGKPIIRMPKTGALDKGDIFGLLFHNQHVAVECKSPGKDQGYKMSQWMRETEVETVNSASVAGILLIKRFRSSIPDSLCVMNKDTALTFGLDIDSIPTRRTQGYNKWWDFILEDTYSKFPVRGQKDCYYYACALSTIVDLFDKHKELIEISLEDSQIEALQEGKEVVIEPQYPGMPKVVLAHL